MLVQGHATHLVLYKQVDDIWSRSVHVFSSPLIMFLVPTHQYSLHANAHMHRVIYKKKHLIQQLTEASEHLQI